MKAVNDIHGRAVGDLLLQAVADVFRARLRTGDIAARFGGDEFCVLLPRTEIAGGLKVAQDLSAAVAARRVPTGVGETGSTVSIGVAVIDSGDDSATCALARADVAMYIGKRAGGGRVVAEDPAAPRPGLSAAVTG